MDTPRPTGDRVPLGDLTNTTHRGNHTRSGLVALDGDRNEQKRQMETEWYETTSDEKERERNKKPRQRYNISNQENVYLENKAAHSTDANTNNETDENSDWFHRQSTFGNSKQQLSDGTKPLSCIDGTDDVHDINSEEDISTFLETGSGCATSPINRLITCPKERRRNRDRARKAAMSPQQRALLNKRQRELYAQKKASKKSAKMLQMTLKETSQSTDGPSIGGNEESPPLGDIDNNLNQTDINTVQKMGTPL